jgi:CelD/BcsL family acetyltransferase involved in cellulose biosynthesis
MASEAKWAELLAQSDADSLFLSWEWLTQWWSRFGATHGYVANIVGFYRDESLIGVAPFYERRVVRRGLVPARSMQLIGHSWRDSTPLITIYLDVIARRGEADAVRQACIRELFDNGHWSELAIGYTLVGGEWKAAAADKDPSAQYYVRELDRAVSFQVDLSLGFSHYLESLGQSTRRSLWNLRKRLQSYGSVRLEHLSTNALADGFRDLNRLHKLRWHRPAFAGTRLDFHRTLATQLSTRNELAFSRLWVGERVVSVLYDIRKGAYQYNIKLGFDPAFSNHLSLGLLHLGYALEAAAHSGVSVYDLLAGPGRKSDYKRHLSQVRRELSCVQILRGSLLPTLYRWHDRVRGL